MLTRDAKSLDALVKRLKAIEEKIARKALRKAARKAMNIVRADAKANAPRDTGLIKGHFALVTAYRKGNLYAKVGIRGGAKKNPDTPYYFRMVEFGTRYQRANPFMLPALENNADAVADTVAEELNKALDTA